MSNELRRSVNNRRSHVVVWATALLFQLAVQTVFFSPGRANGSARQPAADSALADSDSAGGDPLPALAGTTSVPTDEASGTTGIPSQTLETGPAAEPLVAKRRQST